MRREIKILLLVEFLIAISLGILGPYYAIYVEKISNNPSIIGYSYAVFCFTVGVFSPIFGKISDKNNRNLLIIIGGTLSFIISIFYNIITLAYQILILEFLNGIATACFNPAYKSITADFTRKKKRGFEYGLLDSISYITYGMAALLATILFSYFGVKALFIFSGAFHFASSLILSRNLLLKTK
ncbi:MAG: MFS transporter [Candidatus Aenigmatarchaeota archaeon]